jgi:FixJ family two-component response regulator
VGELICIVDDDLSVRRALGRLVKSFGFKVQLFASARECLNAAYIDQAACLIADITMPDMDGFEMYSLLKATDRAIPTVFISARDDSSFQGKAISIGGIAFVSKPCDEKQLHRAIDAALAA